PEVALTLQQQAGYMDANLSLNRPIRLAIWEETIYGMTGSEAGIHMRVCHAALENHHLRRSRVCAANNVQGCTGAAKAKDGRERRSGIQRYGSTWNWIPDAPASVWNDGSVLPASVWNDGSVLPASV
ncbi:MAG: hypothetical protein ACREU0_08215, partial [Burkholderiales bacterium]